MKALKLRLYQETACYKKPFAYKVTETYPLPPYSTVIGLLHKVLGAESGEYFPMDISVQGTYEGIFNTYNTTLFYKANNVTSMPLNVHMLLGVSLIIHVKAEEDTITRIIEGFKNSGEVFTLGRNEDLVRLDSIEMVELREVTLGRRNNESYPLKHNIYIPYSYELENEGISYKLPKRYRIVKGLRRWDKVQVKYVEHGNSIERGTYYLDNDINGEDLVFLG